MILHHQMTVYVISCQENGEGYTPTLTNSFSRPHTIPLQACGITMGSQSFPSSSRHATGYKDLGTMLNIHEHC